MHDPPPRRPRRADLVQNGGKRGGISHIPRIDLCVRAGRFEFSHSFFTARCGGSSAAHESDRPCTLGNEPARRLEAETFDPAGDQIGPVSPRRDWRRLAQPYWGISAMNEHEFADMACRLHQAESIV